MRIFRCISARELTNMYKGINDRDAVVIGENTHRYESGKDYVHFLDIVRMLKCLEKF